MQDKKPPQWIDRHDNKTPLHLAKTQQQRLLDWHDFLTSESCDNYPELESFRYYGEQVEFEGSPRGAEICENSEAGLLEKLFDLLGQCVYPPPELLLALKDLWEIYLAHEGRLTLEEVFIGKGKPKVGNKAVEEAKETRKMLMYLDFYENTKKGDTQLEAAEKLADRSQADAESIVRTMRKYSKEGKNADLVHLLGERSNKKADK